MFPLFIVKHSHYVSRTAKLFIYLFTYLCLHLLLPESLDVNSEQVITEREMALIIDAMNSLWKKKKRNSSQGNSPTPCFQSQDSESNHTCIWGFLEWPLRHQNLPKITKMFVLSWESGDVSISAFRPLFLISRQHLIKHLECGLRAATALPKPVLRGFPRASFPTIAAETLRGA